MLTNYLVKRKRYTFAPQNRNKNYLIKIKNIRVIILVSILCVLTICRIGFNRYGSKSKPIRYESETTLSPFSTHKKYQKTISLDNVVFLTKDYIGFKEALAFKESQGRYSVVNKFGYMGKYQFGKGTLQLIGIKNSKDFLHNPMLQERAFYANLSRNKWILRREINCFSNTWMKGNYITESGILAAAHLVGPGAVKKYLRSYGKMTFKDAFGTTLVDYLKKFKSFDISEVVGDRKAKA